MHTAKAIGLALLILMGTVMTISMDDISVNGRYPASQLSVRRAMLMVDPRTGQVTVKPMVLHGHGGFTKTHWSFTGVTPCQFSRRSVRLGHLLTATLVNSFSWVLERRTSKALSHHAFSSAPGWGIVQRPMCG
jgi:hypothetical protein